MLHDSSVSSEPGLSCCRTTRSGHHQIWGQLAKVNQPGTNKRSRLFWTNQLKWLDHLLRPTAASRGACFCSTILLTLQFCSAEACWGWWRSPHTPSCWCGSHCPDGCSTSRWWPWRPFWWSWSWLAPEEQPNRETVEKHGDTTTNRGNLMEYLTFWLHFWWSNWKYSHLSICQLIQWISVTSSLLNVSEDPPETWGVTEGICH